MRLALSYWCLDSSEPLSPLSGSPILSSLVFKESRWPEAAYLITSGPVHVPGVRCPLPATVRGTSCGSLRAASLLATVGKLHLREMRDRGLRVRASHTAASAG